MITKQTHESFNIFLQTICLRLAFVLSISCYGMVFPVTNTVAADTFWTSPNDGDWFDSLNWGGPIPNAPGDIAHLLGIPESEIIVDLTSQVTLGQLDIFGQSTFVLSGTGPLVFDNAGVGPALLRIVTLPKRHRIEVPLGIVDGVQLIVEVPLDASLELNGGITSGNGDLVKNGLGTLELSGPNPSWDGVFQVNQGLAVVNDIMALGSTLGHTVINGGTLQISSSTDEPFTLQAGVLKTDSSNRTLNGQLTIPEGSTASVQGRFRIYGGSSGDGDLHLVDATRVDNNPLSHSGGLTISSGGSYLVSSAFYIDNTYQGHTTVDSVQLSVTTPYGLGTISEGTTVVNGELRLVPTSQEDVRLENSTLSFHQGSNDISLNRFLGNVTLNSGTISTYAPFSAPDQYTIVNPIILDGGMNTIEPEKGALRIEGGIVGYGDLLLIPDDQAPIEVASLIEHTGKLEIRGGPVRFLAPNVFSETALIHNGGLLLVEASQSVDRLMTSYVHSGCCSTYGSVEVLPGNTLDVNRLHFYQGSLKGNIQSPSPLSFHGFQRARTISNLNSDLDVNVWGGELIVDDSDTSQASTNGNLSVLRSREASILLAANSVIDSDIFLNNASGLNYAGALWMHDGGNARPSITLRGDLYLGDQGAYIGGGDGMRLEGQIYGGDLHLGRLSDKPNLGIVAGVAAYTGETNIFSGEIALAEQGSIANTSVINIYGDGALYIDNAIADGLNSDRVADHLQINLHGGEVSAWPSQWGVNVTERLGSIHLERGRSFARGTHFYGRGSLESVATLVVGEITRNPGSILSLENPGIRRSSLEFNQTDGPPERANLELEIAPQLVNGILPAWLMASHVQFATIGSNGIENYSGPTVDFIGSDSTSIVRPTSRTLDQDRVIHSWNSFGSAPSVDLDGHTLTVGSGGLIGPELSNGILLPGEHSNGELVIATEFVMDADIADNGQPTSVIYVGDGTAGGNNTYTGTTYFVGSPGDDVQITNASALPAGGDIDISGYTTVNLRDSSGNTAYQFGEINIRDGGTFSMNCCGDGDTVAADVINIEQGRLLANLTGNAVINKRTTGLATMSFDSPSFAGTVNVYEGTLHLDRKNGYRSIGAADVVVHSDARLVLSIVGDNQNAPSPNIVLAGGSLFGSGTASDHNFNLKGTLEVTENSSIYLLSGINPQLYVADFRVDGSIHVHAGKSLSVNGISTSDRGLAASQGLQLDPGAILGGNGHLRALVDIAEGAILSPGLLSENSSVGRLGMTIDSPDVSKIMFGENGRYRWEINDANGDPGAPFGAGWDLMNSGAELLVNSTPQNPFIIEVAGLDEFGNDGQVSNLLPNVNYRWPIAEVGRLNSFLGVINGFDPDKFEIDVSQLQQFHQHVHANNFWLESDGTAIYLNGLIVPEPSTLLLCTLAGMIAGFRRTKRCPRYL